MPNKAVHLPAGSGPAYWGAGDIYTFLITGDESGGAYFTMLAQVPPGSGPPPHIHHREEEQFYVIDGEITFRLGNRTIQASSGDFVHVPRETIHNFRNNGALPARMLITYCPAGVEKLFQQAFVLVTDPSLPPPPMTEDAFGRFTEIAPSYGLETLSPDDPRLSAQGDER